MGYKGVGELIVSCRWMGCVCVCIRALVSQKWETSQPFICSGWNFPRGWNSLEALDYEGGGGGGEGLFETRTLKETTTIQRDFTLKFQLAFAAASRNFAWSLQHDLHNILEILYKRANARGPFVSGAPA